MPHTQLEENALADQLPGLPSPAREFLEEYVLLRASGAMVCGRDGAKP